MNIAVYTRKSVFSDKSDSTETQAKICKEYARNNYETSSIVEYEDEGFTGANTNRPGFTQLMNDVSNKKINVLICYKIDRISRNVLDFSKTFSALQDNNVQFVSVKEQIDTSTPLGRAMMYICSVFAQMERETTSERVKDNMIELAKSGKWAGGQAPLGYKLKKIIVNGKSHTTLERNEEEIPLLLLIYEKFLSGYTLNGLETYFRKCNIKSLKNNYLSATQLYNILKNPHCVAANIDVYNFFENKGCIMASDIKSFDGEHGLVVYRRTQGGKKKTHTINTPDKWIVSVGIHKPIISAEDWLKAQQCFGKNKIDKTRKHEIGILKGVVKCKCGYSMRVHHKVDKEYNKTYDYYFCQNRNRRGTDYCDLKMVSVKTIDTAIMSVLSEMSLNKELFESFVRSESYNKPLRSSADIKKNIKSIENKIMNLTSSLQENQSSSASKYIIAEIEKLDKQIISLNYELRELSILERENKEKIKNNHEIYTIVCDYVSRFDELEYSDKNAFLKEILKECIWDGSELFIRF